MNQESGNIEYYMIIFQNSNTHDKINVNVLFVNTQSTYLKKILCDLISQEFTSGNIDQYHVNKTPKSQEYVNNFIEFNDNFILYSNYTNIRVMSDYDNEWLLNSILSISDSVDEFLSNIQNTQDVLVL